MKTQINILSPIRVAETPSKTFASTVTLPQNGVQPDLLYMDSVLVSTGKNKNTDVFLANEMWKARSSPILKPVDWEHNTGKELLGQPGTQATSRSIIEDNQIIGVMYNSFAALKDGQVISEEMALAEGFEIPQEFDIINQAAIYKYLYPKAAAKIVRDAKAGNLFVSMEAWFSDYDYQVGDKVVARNEETAFLDRHLRANGGDGLFGDVSVGRVLRNIVFGGVGIVANPANEDSVIHSFTNANLQQYKPVNSAVASYIIGEIPGASASEQSQEVIEIMSDQKTNDTTPAFAGVSHEDYKGVVERLVKAEHELDQKEAAVASAKAEAEKLQASFDGLNETFAEGVKTLAEALGAEASQKLQSADASTFFGVLAELVGERAEATKDLESKLAEATQKVADLEIEKRSIAREAQIEQLLAEYTSDDEKKEERKKKMVEATKTLDDEAFAAHLEDTKDLLSIAVMSKKTGEEKKDEEERGVTAKRSPSGHAG